MNFGCKLLLTNFRWDTLLLQPETFRDSFVEKKTFFSAPNSILGIILFSFLSHSHSFHSAQLRLFDT